MGTNDPDWPDARVRAILDIYHRRIADERSAPRENMPEGRDARLLAVGPETGRFLSILARSLERLVILELGTSYGYSGIWLADAARATGGRLTTIEVHPEKSAHARKMSREAGLEESVDFLIGDAVAMIGDLKPGIDLVLIDLWKDLYELCLHAFLPKLNPGAIIVADNMIRPVGEGQEKYARAIRATPGISSVLLPVGSGLEISVWSPDAA